MANGSTTRYTDAPYNISFDSNTYTAQGVFLGVSETEENADDDSNRPQRELRGGTGSAGAGNLINMPESESEQQ